MKLLSQSGYTAAVPASESGMRSDGILVIFAGPFASLLAGLLLALVFLQLPGSAWERNWPIVAAFSLMFLADFGVNLIPIGYSDGTMLWHLILWTRHGQDLHSHLLGAKISEDADERAAEFDLVGELRLRQTALKQALARGGRNSADLGLCYQALGFAQIRLWLWEEAEMNLRKSLDILVPRIGDDPLFVANSWSGLSTACRIRHDLPQAKLAYDSAVAAYEKRKQMATRADRVNMRATLAKLYADFENFSAALRESGHALEELPAGVGYLLRKAELYRIRMECEFHLGSPERGFKAAEEAARILRGADIPETQRNQTIAALDTLGLTFWTAGRTSETAALLNESIRAFEERGLLERAARVRLTLSMVLRKDGILADAETALPKEENVSPDQRWRFLQERSELLLESGRVEEAIAGFAAMQLAVEDQQLGPLWRATAEESLAAAYFAADRLEESEAAARRACDVIRSAGHPDLAEPMVTLALIAWRRGQEASPYWPEALRIIVDVPLLNPSIKGRFLERTARRLERAGRTEQAAEARDAAAAQWKTLGLIKS